MKRFLMIVAAALSLAFLSGCTQSRPEVDLNLLPGIWVEYAVDQCDGKTLTIRLTGMYFREGVKMDFANSYTFSREYYEEFRYLSKESSKTQMC